MFKFVREQKYRRQDVWEVVKGKDVRMSRNFQQSGYERIDENLFAFINIGYKGHAGQIFPNKWNSESQILMWYGKKATHSNQPLMRGIIDGFITVYCFARWSLEPEFTYLGIGNVLKYRDNFRDVYDQDGSQTFCIEFELSCQDSAIHPAFINNFDSVYEEELSRTVEGSVNYRRHKTRERDPEIIKRKKREFQAEHGKLFCEVCLFDFGETYGSRGEGFIECHHNIPLHEGENERITSTADLSLLCSNCHRMIHRKKKWLTVQDLRNVLENSQLSN